MSYPRLYVGLRRPFDVATGIVIGLAGRWAGFRLALRRWGRLAAAAQETSAEPGGSVREVEYGEVVRS